jgi:hypothetical protein
VTTTILAGASHVYRKSRRPLPTTYTTGIRGFAECRTLCRVPFVGHSTKKALSRAALGKVRLSVTSLFTECRTLGTGPHSAKTCLPSVKHSAKKALGKGLSAAVLKLTDVSLCREPRTGTRQRGFFAECQILGTRHSANHIFVFYILATKLFVVCSYTM